MLVGLVDADSHNFPNLPLMKLSGWHKAQGDQVKWYNANEHFDRVYISKVFTESVDPIPSIIANGNADGIINGGSGYDLKNKLPYEIEHTCPDYSLYPQFNFALGFLTRGCPRVSHAASHGGFCITPDKDGCKPHKTADLAEFYTGQKEIYLLDQNLLACKERIELIRQLAASGAKIDFSGGLDIRYMTDDVIAEMRQLKVKEWHFAWDDPRENLLPAFVRVAQSGITRQGPASKNKPGVYVLTNFWSTHAQDMYRIYTLRMLGYSPYVMIYDKQKFVDERGRLKADVWDRYTPEQIYHFKVCQHLQRWTANRALFASVPLFDNYERYQNFVNRQWPKMLEQYQARRQNNDTFSK